MKPQLVPLQVAFAFAGGLHGLHDEPQLFTSVLDTHALPQRWKPALQRKSHCSLLQIGIAFAGAWHGVQDEPHELTSVFWLHAPPQRWKPGLQVKSQWLPVHAGTAFATPSHDAHDGPQACTLSSAMHCCPHGWKPALQLHWWSRVSQAPGCGQSLFALQPGSHCFEPWLQKKPAGHAAVVQSAGSCWHWPPWQAWFELHTRPQTPQL